MLHYLSRTKRRLPLITASAPPMVLGVCATLLLLRHVLATAIVIIEGGGEEAGAEAAGYQALAVTVDAPVLGRREADLRNKCAASITT